MHQRQRWPSVRSLRGPTQWRLQHPLQQVQRSLRQQCYCGTRIAVQVRCCG